MLPPICVGVTLFDAALDGPVPAPFVAVTVNVYAMFVVSPETVIGEAAPVAVRPPGEDVTVYVVMAELPVLEGAVKATDAEVGPATDAVTDVGAPGRTGQTPPPTACICCSSVQTPEAALDEVVGAVAEMTPPL
jgi:hypothetical protein